MSRPVRIVTLCFTSLALAFCAPSIATAQDVTPTPETTTPEVFAPESPAASALIDELTRAGGTPATRLHPDLIWRSLHMRRNDKQLGTAFEKALSEVTVESRSALLRVLELQFIHDPTTSALDLLGDELRDHFRGFDWQFADYPGGPAGDNESFADVMVDALDLICPERRANSSRNAIVLREEATEDVWQYMTEQWSPVPGQEDWKLNRHALESFVRMREQAKKDGVELVILSSHRDRKVAEANAARINNANAVASFSSHSLGLAIDFKMSQGDEQFLEISTRPMAEVVRMRQSPVHKWLVVRAAEFGWFPYQNEPWHWEYNPVGFRPVFWADFPGGAPARAYKPEPTPTPTPAPAAAAVADQATSAAAERPGL